MLTKFSAQALFNRTRLLIVRLMLNILQVDYGIVAELSSVSKHHKISTIFPYLPRSKFWNTWELESIQSFRIIPGQKRIQSRMEQINYFCGLPQSSSDRMIGYPIYSFIRMSKTPASQHSTRHLRYYWMATHHADT